jgi:hypothetical protein
MRYLPGAACINVSLHVKYPLFLWKLNVIGMYRQIVIRISKILNIMKIGPRSRETRRSLCIHIVTYRPVTRQQACKHIPATEYSTQQ